MLFLRVILLSLLAFSLSAQAAQKRKKAKIRPQNEVYAAIEDSGEVVPAVEEPVAPAVAKSKEEAQPQIVFETVPAEQSDLIARRLPLVAALLTRHNRAYDYRNHTVAELESILKKLDAN